ncbi:Succinyl-diaminopimelate desuccinylase [Planctomycetes bacterium Poly30]|uniref:Succinyl-diaminopimelate desuccinylase n=1 Tax=Saltatorellus ferox TaxID=2528018 RepID=A0A518EYP5_9BACT|nr:Succinyl-diaminopimelate desuccinylase [Planctomycetes bacterium Poly30]
MKSIAQELSDWIDIESITGNEGAYGAALGRALTSEGFSVEYQEVAPGRSNLLGRADRPEVVFCTHLDTVPPFIPPRIERGTVWGRGACDAKGQALAMLLAAKRLVAEGERRVGFLFTVGEEIDSAGAAFADARLAADPSLRDEWSPRFTIVGEPTGNVFVSGHKGIFLGELVGSGVAGHSSNPLGPSAIHELVGCCAKLTQADWGEDADLGRGSINVGTFHGGHAPNVVAPEARAQVLVRAVEDPGVVRARIEAALGPHVKLVEARQQSGPVRFHVPEGEPSFSVAFGTDAPHLSRWGQPLLMGPGSIDLAHTKDERIEVAEIEAAVTRYCETVRRLLD